MVTPDHVAVLDSCQNGLHILRGRPLNVLIERPADASDIVLRAIRREVREPVCEARGDRFQLPRFGRQVISTTAIPLFALVARKLFDASLYYRLNVFLLRVGTFDPGEAPPLDHSARPSTITSYT